MWKIEFSVLQQNKPRRMVRFSRLRYIVCTHFPFSFVQNYWHYKIFTYQFLHLVIWDFFEFRKLILLTELIYLCFKPLQIQKSVYILISFKIKGPSFVAVQLCRLQCQFFRKNWFSCYAIKLKVLKQVLNIKLFSCTSRNAPNCCGNCNALLQLDCGQQ